MNTKYKTSTSISKDNYNSLSISVISHLCKEIKEILPFSPYQCTFIYNSNNTIYSCDINNIPKNLSVQTTDYFMFDLISENDESVSVIFMPDSISVSACLPYDYKDTKGFTNDIINLAVNNTKKPENSSKSNKKKANIFKRFLKKSVSYIVILIKLIKAFF